MIHGEQVDILVVEDNDGERDTIVNALESAISNVVVVAVNNGEKALDFLFCRNEWAARLGDAPPRLILLDLALPDSDEFSILGQIRSLEGNDELTLTPVVIFSDSRVSANISNSYRCGANSYVIKPLSFPDFQSVVEKIGQYWMTHNVRSN